MSKRLLFVPLLIIILVQAFASAAFAGRQDDLGFSQLEGQAPRIDEAATSAVDTFIGIDEKTLDAVIQKATRSWEVGGRNVFGVDLMAGLTTGLRIKVIPWKSGRVQVSIEALVAGAANGAGLGGEFGVGGRVELIVASDHRYNALYISPGVDFRVMPGSAGTSGQWLHFDPYTNVYIVSATVDVSWVHEFSPHFAWQVIGLHLGAGVGLGGETSTHANARGMILPELSLFTGLRF